MADTEKDLHFPKAGLDVSRKANEWPVRVAASGERYYTCADALNVRGFDATTGRHRGGSRPGLSKFVDAQIQNYLIQDLNVVVAAGIDPPGGNVQFSLSGRIVTLVAVVAGNIRVINRGDAGWTSPTNNANNNPPLNASGIVYSTSNRQKMYFADGLDDRVLYQASTNTVEDWIVTEGTAPVDGDGNAPRLIATWRGRVLQSGLFGDPQNIFASAVKDATNYDYNPANPSATQAWALDLSDIGLIGDVVTGLVPCTDDVLVVLGDSSIRRITGDPAYGGQADLISDSIGAAFGQAWCKGPDGTIYFFSNVPGVYAIPPMGQGQPTRISHQIDPRLRDVNTGTSVIRMLWDDDRKGVRVYITPDVDPNDASFPGADAVIHWFWEAPRPDGSGNAWFPDNHANPDHNPVACCTIDGNEADDRALVIGSWDGYVRVEDPDATTDDGTVITSRVTLGPILTPTGDEMRLKSMQGTFADGSADVDYSVKVGKDAETALASTGVVPDTFSAGRGYTKLVNRAAHAIYVELESTGQWAMESIRIALAGTLSRIRRRRNG